MISALAVFFTLISLMSHTVRCAVVPANSASDFTSSTSYLFQNDVGALYVSQESTPTAGFKRVVSIVANISFLDVGWDFIQVSPAPWLLMKSENEAYYLSGYLEGYITYVRQILYVNNFTSETPESAKTWVREHIQYINETSRASFPSWTAEEVLFWGSIRNQLSLMEGITDGYNAANNDNGLKLPKIEFFDIFLLNFGNDLMDVIGATQNTTQQSQQNNLRRLRLEQHCSALVKVTPEDIYFSHVTW